MNRLIDAFLELPAWEGIALIALAVAIQAALCLIFATIANRKSQFENGSSR